MRSLSLSGILTALFLMVPTLILSHRLETITQRASESKVTFRNFPNNLGPWQGEDSTELDSRSQSILQLDEYLRKEYRTADGKSVFLYLGYWKKQSGEQQAAKHSPLMCFPANGLTISRPEERLLPATFLGGTNSQFAVSRLVATEKRRSSLYFYWFFSGQKTYRDETYGLINVLRSTLLEGRSDGGIIEISTPLSESADSASVEGNAENTLRDFSAYFVPELERALKGKDSTS